MSKTNYVEVDRIGDVLVLEISAPTLNDFDIAHAVSDQIEFAVARGKVLFRNLELLGLRVQR